LFYGVRVKPSRKGTARLRESVHTLMVAGREWRALSRRATGGADRRRESGDGEQEIDPEQGRNKEEEERFALGGVVRCLLSLPGAGFDWLQAKPRGTSPVKAQIGYFGPDWRG
jgi:hypothetical protein